MDKVTLKNCPFCGAAASLERESDHHGEWFNLGCSQHWGTTLTAEGGCPGGRIWYTEDPSDMDQAITAWNTRTHVVSEEMVERSCAAYRRDRGQTWTLEAAMRAALIAALSPSNTGEVGNG